ncbi:MAG TPA: tetratricopeptide repeat protein [Bryobacteraceae bacterium]|jgi:tetratricopeptide (TPR) repeat protein|nr:tetratricopeptide repeat protein [Bryobacteraceae bacterium]
MVSRTLTLVIAAGAGCGSALAQVGGALVDQTRIAPSPTRSLTPENRGDIFMARKMYREAIETFLEEPKKTAVIYNKVGIAYHQLPNQMDLAKKYYEMALKLNRNYGEALNNIGTVYYARKNFRRAITYYNRALKINESASVYSNLGTAFFARKEYEKATEAYQKAFSMDPEVFERKSNFGTLLQDRNVEERAKFHYYLAKMYAKAGRNELALQYVRKALEEGFKDKQKLNQDPEFEALRDTPEFQELLTLEPRVL